MRALLALLLALSVALVAGCGQSAKPAQPPAEAKTTTQPADKVAAPITITPDPGPLAAEDPSSGATIDASDGVSEKEAQIVGGYYLREIRKAKLGDAYGTSVEAFTLLNQVKVQSEWLLTYSRTTVDGNPADAYAATIAVDAKTGKQTRYTEAP